MKENWRKLFPKKRLGQKRCYTERWFTNLFPNGWSTSFSTPVLEKVCTSKQSQVLSSQESWSWKHLTGSGAFGIRNKKTPLVPSSNSSSFSLQKLVGDVALASPTFVMQNFIDFLMLTKLSVKEWNGTMKTWLRHFCSFWIPIAKGIISNYKFTSHLLIRKSFEPTGPTNTMNKLTDSVGNIYRLHTMKKGWLNLQGKSLKWLASFVKWS